MSFAGNAGSCLSLSFPNSKNNRRSNGPRQPALDAETENVLENRCGRIHFLWFRIPSPGRRSIHGQPARARALRSILESNAVASEAPPYNSVSPAPKLREDIFQLSEDFLGRILPRVLEFRA